MACNAGEKRLKLFLLTYLIIAMIGSSAISAAEAFCIEQSSNDSLNSGRYFSSKDHTVDWLAGNVLTTRKTRSYSNSLLRNKLLRVFALTGAITISICLTGTNIKTTNDNIPIMRNLIPLKLRI